MSRKNLEQFHLRLPPWMMKRIRKAAGKEGIQMAEYVRRILSGHPDLQPPGGDPNPEK